jgi:recombination protein RecR
MQFTSQIVESAVDSLSSFPGIGKRTALRMVMHLLKRPEMDVANMAQSILKLKTELFLCEECATVSDTTRCNICSDVHRLTDTICIVEEFSDLMAIESTGQYKGLYHVLGGLISPMDGIGPSDLTIEKLINRLETSVVKEVIFALSATVEGDTTMYYLAKRTQSFSITTSSIARGISVGGEIEFVDELTLGRSLVQRTLYTLQ